MNKELLLTEKEIMDLAITEMEFIQLEYTEEILEDKLYGDFLNEVLNFLIMDVTYDNVLLSQYPHLKNVDDYDILELKEEIKTQVAKYF